ncbi:MAG: hypothetical protein QNJ05_14655 [Woeseiaceae bacterium]|nr:hypothetical protein [Woeseiaceae bacterium]
MGLRVSLFILLLLGQSSISVAEPSQIFVQIFDEALSKSTVTACPPTGEVTRQTIPHPFREVIHEALELEFAEFYLTRGIACSPPDSEEVRKIQYWTLNALIVSEGDAVPIIKQTLEELGADDGTRVLFGPSTARRNETLVDGEWVSTEKLGYEFSAEAVIPTSGAQEIVRALSSSNMELVNAGSIVRMIETISVDHAFTFDGELRRQSRNHPVGLVIQKTDGETVVFTLLSRDRHIANLAQTAFDSSL